MIKENCLIKTESIIYINWL